MHIFVKPKVKGQLFCTLIECAFLYSLLSIFIVRTFVGKLLQLRISLCISNVQEAAGHQLKMYAQDVGRVFLHPSSVNFHVGRYESNWLIYSERVQTGKV